MYPFVEGRICENVPEAQHITLRCRQHPMKTWSQKNLGYIGARSLFYNLHYKVDMGEECNCSIDELYHDHADDVVN